MNALPQSGSSTPVPAPVGKRLPGGRVGAWSWLFLGLLLLHLAPIWTVRYFPSQDGPSHVYNAKILVDGANPANHQLRQTYTWSYALPPNVLSHLILSGLMQLAPPLIAEKLLLSLIIGLLPLAMLYLVRGFERGTEVFSLVGFIFAYHNLLHMGFYSFSLSVPLCLLALGWWWRHRHRMTATRIAVLLALIMATYLAHFAGYAVLMVVLAVTALWSTVLLTGRCFWRAAVQRWPWRRLRHALLQRLRWGLTFAGYMLPAILLGWDYYFRTRAPGTHDQERIENVFERTLTLVSYSDWHLHLTPYIRGLTLAALVLTLLYRLFRKQGLRERDGILIACAILAWFFFTMPAWSNRGGWVNDRIFILGFLLLWTCFTRFHKPLRIALGAALIVLGVLHTGRLTLDYHRVQPVIREFTDGVALIEPHSTLEARIGRAGLADIFPGGSRHVGPLTHVVCYYGLGRDVALFHNYEAHHNYFMTGWGRTPRRDADYAVVWGHAPTDAVVRNYARHYDLIHESEHLRLFRRQRREPELEAWETLDDGRLRLRLRMLTPTGDDADPGLRAIARNHVFKSGSFGWLRNPPGREWRQAEALDAGPFPELVGDQDDRVFRVDLPNGRYQVTCHFPPHPEGHYEINIIANDRPVVERLVVEQDGEAARIVYTTDVTDGHLTQVLYTTWRRSTRKERLRTWAIGGIELERLVPDEPASAP